MPNTYIKKSCKLLIYIFNCDIMTFHYIYDYNKSVVIEKFSVKLKKEYQISLICVVKSHIER